MTAALLGRRPGFSLIPLLLALLFGVCSPAWAQETITGVVQDADNGSPIAGARVQIQTRPETAVTTDSQGRFELSVAGLSDSKFSVAAALAYDAGLPINYKTAVNGNVSPGGDILIELVRAPGGDNASYQPAPSSACASCHKDQHAQWSASNHARAAINVRVRDLYSGDGTTDNPHSGRGYVFTDTHAADNSGLCATCHAPNERPADPGSVKYNEIATDAGMEGVTCTSCHQLHVINHDVDKIHLLGNAEFFLPDASRPDLHVWGPLPDVGSKMEAFYAPVFSDSRMCASCHEYVTPATGAPGQETYSEWLASPAAVDGISCQDCHMPPAATAGVIANGGPTRPREQRRDHSFPGVYSGRLGDPVALTLAVGEVTADTVSVRSELTSLVSGHRWPTGVDPRNALLVIEASLNGQPLAQVGGDVLPFWASAEPEIAPGDGDYAGRPGRGYAKVLEGRINGEGDVVRPVNFIDAEALSSKTTLMPEGTDVGSYTFELPAEIPQNSELEVRGRVLYRRVWRDWAVAKGWTEIEMDEPWERLVDELTITQTLGALASYTVTATAGEGGSIEPASVEVDHGASASFTVTPDTNYVTADVSGCGGSLAGSLFTTSAITAACTVTATFRLKTYTLDYSAGPNGSISGISSQTVEHGSDGSPVEAAPDTGYSFVRWSDGSTVNPRTDTNVIADIGVEAEFAINRYTVTPSAGVGGTIDPATAQTVDHGQSAIFTVTADQGYSVVDVTGCGGSLEGSLFTTGAITGDCSVTAEFSVNAYPVTLTAAPADGGSVAGGGTHDFGSSVTISASPAEGYSFVNWTEGGDQVSGSAEYTFSMPDRARDLVANFTAGSYVVTLGASPEGGGSVSGAGGYEFEEQVTIVAEANEGYSFVNWTEGGDQVSTEASYTFAMPAASRSLVANFTRKTYTITASAGEGGEITPPEVEVEHGDTAVFTVSPDEGYSIETVIGCGGGLAGETYTTAEITRICQVIAEFVRVSEAVFGDRFEVRTPE